MLCARAQSQIIQYCAKKYFKIASFITRELKVLLEEAPLPGEPPKYIGKMVARGILGSRAPMQLIRYALIDVLVSSKHALRECWLLLKLFHPVGNSQPMVNNGGPKHALRASSDSANSV